MGGCSSRYLGSLYGTTLGIVRGIMLGYRGPLELELVISRLSGTAPPLIHKLLGNCTSLRSE